MPQRSVATNYTFEQQRTEINLLAADFWSHYNAVESAKSTYLKHDGTNDFTGGTLAVPAAFTINSNSGAGTLTISGNLNVTGTTTTVNTTNLDVTDKNITIAKGNTSDATADGAGITIDSGTDITWNFVDAKDAWVSSIGVEATTTLKVGGVASLHTAQFSGTTAPSAGHGVEIGAPDGNTGQVIVYDRDNSAYKQLNLKGSSVQLYTGTTNALAGTFNSTGLTMESGKGIISPGAVLVGTSTSNDFKFKVSDDGGYEFAFNPNDGGLNSLVNYDRANGAYVDCKITQKELQLWTGASPSEKVRIHATGELQIGDTTASSLGERLLQVGKTDRTGTYIEVRTSTTGVGGVVFSDGTAADSTGYRGTIEYDHGAVNADEMYFKTAAEERLRINSVGKVLVGDGSAITPVKHFDVRGAGNQGILIGSTDNNGAQIILDGNGGGDASGGNYGGIEVLNNGDFTFRNHDASQSIIVGVGSASGANDSIVIKSDGNVGINESSPDNKLHLTTTSSTAYETNTSNTQNLTNALLKLENLDGTDGGGVNNYVGIQFAVANGATSSAQLNYVRTGDNSGRFTFKARNGGGSDYPNLMDITSAGQVLIGASSSTSNAKLAVSGAVGTPEAFFELNRTDDPAGDQNIGVIEFSQGNAASRLAARIITRRDGGVWGAASLPTRFEFHTCISGSNTTSEKIRIASNGNLLPGGDNSQDIGSSSSKRFANLYLYNTTYFGPNGSLVKENNLRFQASGASYIDQATAGQNLIFRTSDSSSLDVTAGYISNKGTLSLSGATNSRALEINAGGGASTLVFDRNGHITSNIRAGDGYSNVSGGSGGGSRITLNKEYMQFWTYPYVNGYIEPTYSKRFQVDNQGASCYGSGNGNGRYHFTNETANTNRHVEHSFARVGGSNRGTTACVYVGENSNAQGEVIVVTSGSNGSLSSGVIINNNSQSWSAYSDTRLKNKISDITNALTGISQIDTWKYSMKDDSTNEPKLGVTAQSVQSVYPEVISQRDRITDDTDDTEYLQVAYTELIPVCIAAIKELKAKVETLEAEVTTLKSA